MRTRLARLWLLGLLLLLAPGHATPASAAPLAVATQCGVERWPVKTLADPDAGRVDPVPVPATVAALRQLPAPATLPDRARVAPVELTTYAVTVDLIAAKLEDDGDIHLVVAEPGTPAATMIAEFPDPDCALATAPPLRARLAQARAALLAATGNPSAQRFVPLAGRVTLAGVGFFDRPHGQAGAAPNGIELHPVLAFAAAPAGAAPCASFAETGHTLCDRFLAYWQAHGGLAVNGYPLTEARTETLEDGQPYLVQWFERVRLEYHPEVADPQYQVLLGQFGRRIHPAEPPAGAQPGRRFFPETGHNLGDDFLAYWDAHGGLAQFGYPLTEPLTETLEDGRPYTVQYTERARLERHSRERRPAVPRAARAVRAAAPGRGRARPRAGTRPPAVARAAEPRPEPYPESRASAEPGAGGRVSADGDGEQPQPRARQHRHRHGHADQQRAGRGRGDAGHRVVLQDHDRVVRRRAERGRRAGQLRPRHWRGHQRLHRDHRRDGHLPGADLHDADRLHPQVTAAEQWAPAPHQGSGETRGVRVASGSVCCGY